MNESQFVVPPRVSNPHESEVFPATDPLLDQSLQPAPQPSFTPTEAVPTVVNTPTSSVDSPNSSLPPTPPTLPARSSSSLVSVFGLIALLAVLAVGGYYLFQQRLSSQPSMLGASPQPTSQPEDLTACTMEAKICPDGSSVGRSGPNCEFAECPGSESVTAPDTATSASQVVSNSSITSTKTYSEDMFRFTYPTDFKKDTSVANQVTLVKETLPNTSERTTDGARVSLTSIDLEGKTLEQWVDEATRLKYQGADGVMYDSFSVVKPKAATTLNGYSGFSYSLSQAGAGEVANYIVVQKNSASKYAVQVMVSVSGPQTQQLQKEVESILASLKIDR